MEYAIKSLVARRQSEFEMRKKLKMKFPKTDPEPIIVRLKELDYINDEAFIAAWIRHRSLTSPRGRYLLAQELKQKGIAKNLIEDQLSAFDDRESLKSLALKRWSTIKESSIFRKKTKLTLFLASRGFDFSEIMEVVNSVASSKKF